ncbi:hypothetical protein BCR36DRAFT_311563, partial [Piromyces finnis]
MLINIVLCIFFANSILANESKIFCRYNHQGVTKVYDPAYFDKDGNVVFAKTIEEYAKILGPTWYGVSWFSNNPKYNPYHKSLIIGINDRIPNIRHATGGIMKLPNSINNVINNISNDVANGISQVSIAHSEGSTKTDDKNLSGNIEHSESAIHGITEDDTHAITNT